MNSPESTRTDRIQPTDRPGPRVVAFGGGSGMTALLKGLKRQASHTTAIVTMADDGGSSGQLRKHLDVVPPGDIRNCLVALAGDEPLMADLFQYRFTDGELKGHSFGNLFLTALTKLTGDFHQAVRVANQVLRVEGQVLPCTTRKVTLVAEHFDGSKTTGQSYIARSAKPIRRVELKPDPGWISDAVAEAIGRADIITFGPGSLYTSVIPTLLVGGMQEAVAAAAARRVFIVNVMTQPGETDRHTVEDHVRAFLHHAPRVPLDVVLVNNGPIPAEALERYRREGAEPVQPGRRPLALNGCQVVAADLVSTDSYVRHDPQRLAQAVVSCWQKL